MLCTFTGIGSHNGLSPGRRQATIITKHPAPDQILWWLSVMRVMPLVGTHLTGTLDVITVRYHNLSNFYHLIKCTCFGVQVQNFEPIHQNFTQNLEPIHCNIPILLSLFFFVNDDIFLLWCHLSYIDPSATKTSTRKSVNLNYVWQHFSTDGFIHLFLI